MKKIILTIFILAILTTSAVIVYLNAVVLPVKVKAMIQKSLEDATGKKVHLGDLKAGLLSGLVVKDISISDDSGILINVKELSLRPFIMPFFRKEVIIPVINVKSPVINLERRPDGTFNLADLFKDLSPKTGEFRVIVRRIAIKDGNLFFTDNALAEPFKKELKRLNADIRLLLPGKIRFEADCDMSGTMSTIVGLWGEYSIPASSVTAKLTLTDLSLGEFAPYYADLKVSFPSGKTDVIANLAYAKPAITADLDLRSKEISFTKGDISARLDSAIKAKGSYDFSAKSLKYSGDMSVRSMQLDGIKELGRIDIVSSEVKFTESSFHAEDIKAVVFGMPFDAEAYIPDYKAPLFIVDISSQLSLSALKNLLAEKFNMTIPADINGGGKLYLKWESEIAEGATPDINGYIDMTDARISLGKDKPALEIPEGQVQFTSKQLTWSDLDVRYGGVSYNTFGTLTNFASPGLQISLKSKDLALKAIIAQSGKTVTLSKFTGNYMGSDFSMTGNVDVSDLSHLSGDMSGVINTDFESIKAIAKGSREKIEKAKLAGEVKAEFRVTGRLFDPKLWTLDAKLFSNSISVYDLKPVNVIVEYSQSEGVGNIRRFHSFLYDGTVTASGRMDLFAKGMPYSATADISGVRIEGLKTATALKDKDISGTLRCQARVEGLYEDPSTTRGSGRITINDGRLWQLNLFKGLGVLLFSRDFSNVVFRDGGCSFSIKDKSIYTDDLVLRSSLINLYGSVNIGFDKTIDASMKSEFTDEALVSGSVSDTAAQIGKYSYITIKGSLKDPKYSVRPDVPNIVQDLAAQIFSNQND